MKKYLVFPGMVRAQDGDRHYIGARQLMDLYGVPIEECIVIRRDDYERLGIKKEEYILLYPREDGNYALPA